jgi:hypothetical protein
MRYQAELCLTLIVDQIQRSIQSTDRKNMFCLRAYEFFFTNFIALLLSSMAILYFNCTIYVTQFEYTLSKGQDIHFTTSTGQCA